MTLLDSACRALLRLYPPDMREAHGDDMRATFRLACAQAFRRGGWMAAIRTVLAELADLVKAAILVRTGAPRIPAGRGPRHERRRHTMTWLDDVRLAVRRLRSSPGTVAASALMLGLAIGLTTATFTLVDALLLRPVPFPEADRLARLWMRSESGGRTTVSMPIVEAWRATGVFDAVEGSSTATFTLGEGAAMTERPAAFVSPGLLPLLGAKPIRGRLFLEDEGRAGTDDRVIISEGLWRMMFGADEQAVGRPAIVDGAAVTIVGVMPASFRFPSWNTALWRPLDFRAPPPQHARRQPMPIVRMAPGIPRDDAMKTATAAAHGAATLPANQWAAAESLAAPYQGQYARKAAPILGACAVMVFLVLCANVSGLLLARLEVRRRAIGIAVALGASRARLVREAFFESAALAMAGLALGLAIASLLIALAGAYLPESLLVHTLNPLSLDTRALLGAAVAATAAALAAGLLPALLAPRVAPMASIRTATRSGTDGAAGRALRRFLLVGEVALACTLLAGAALLVRSFVNLATAERGLDPRNVVVGWVSGLGGEKATQAERAALARAVENHLREMPGVARVALSHGAPPNGGGFTVGDWQSDLPGAQPVQAMIETYAVGQDFFDIYGIPLLRGRTFQAADPSDAVIVGERLAALFWPDVDPIGRSFGIGKRRYQVVGVARELHVPTTEGRFDRPEFYYPFVPGGENIALNVRCDGPCPDPALIRTRIRDVASNALIWDLGPLERRYEGHVESPRAAAMLVLVFASVAALALAGGLFAVLSHLAGRRKREFGVRMALGARPSALRALVLREGGTMVAIGAVAGTIAGWWLTKALDSMMYGITPGDLASWAGVLIVLAAISLSASWWPAIRAARVDPSILLREE
jgi:putative ABC transport system permease protein